MIRSSNFCAALTLIVVAVGPLQGGPPLREEGERREQIIADLKATLAVEATATGKADALRQAYKGEPSPDVRRVVFEQIPTPPDTAIDNFLIDVLVGDEDAGLRSLAATALGTHGTAECLTALAKAAATDKVTTIEYNALKYNVDSDLLLNSATEFPSRIQRPARRVANESSQHQP